MACNTCQNTKKIPVCTTSLVLGESTHLSTDIYIFVRNLTTGYLHRQKATTGEAGTVVLDLSQPDPSFYNPYSFYEVWVTLRDKSINDKLSIEIGEESYTCFNMEFEKVYGEGSYVEHELEIE